MWSTPAPSASSITTCSAGFVADREELLRDRLRRREESRAHSGGGNDGTADLHGWDDIFPIPMPTYVYKFVETGETIEVQQAFTDATLDRGRSPRFRRSPARSRRSSRRSVSRSRAVGFFKTDNRDKKSSKAESSPSKDSATKSSSTTDGSTSGGSASKDSGGSSSSSDTSSSSPARAPPRAANRIRRRPRSPASTPKSTNT